MQPDAQANEGIKSQQNDIRGAESAAGKVFEELFHQGKIYANILIPVTGVFL
jgi:hypothetical protein